jgi:hypothetical protein
MYLISKHGQPTRSDPPAWGLVEGLTTLHHKETACYEMLHMASDLDGLFETT